MALADRFQPNPEYGSGIYRRRLRIKKTPDLVVADLLDDYHEMACTLHHDGANIVRIKSYLRRAPFSTCPGASAATTELVGLPLSISRKALYGGGRARRNCTHIFDLLGFAISQARSERWNTMLHFVVPDLSPEGSQVSVIQDGRTVLQWSTNADETIVEPKEHAGRSLFGGFSQWAETNFSGFELELVLHLQKAIFVSRGRRYLIRRESENSIRDEPERLGACFTFSEPQFSIAKPNPDYVRDFTGGLPSF